MRARCPGPRSLIGCAIPVHLTTGWWDLFIRGAVRDWSRLSARSGVESRFVADLTDHAGREWSDGPTPDPLADFDDLADRMPLILARELAFLRRHLLGTSDGDPATASWMLTHVGMQESPSWPPPGVETLAFHLVDGGRAGRGPEGGGLSARPDRVPVNVRWRHDPSDLVPGLDGEAVDGWFRRPDERQTQVRPDVVTFTSDAAREPIDLAGPVTANLIVQPPPAGGHVMAKLCDVYPEGEARRISEGALLLPSGREGVLAPVELGHTGYRRPARPPPSTRGVVVRVPSLCPSPRHVRRPVDRHDRPSRRPVAAGGATWLNPLPLRPARTWSVVGVRGSESTSSSQLEGLRRDVRLRGPRPDAGARARVAAVCSAGPRHGRA